MVDERQLVPARPLRIAIIGCGEHSMENLIPALAGLSCVDVRSVCDPNLAAAHAASRRFGTCAVDLTTADVLSRSDVEAVIVAATPQVHFEVARDALRRNLHVFVEKPPTAAIVELQRLADDALQRKLVTCVGHNLRHAAAGREMRSVVHGQVGSAVDSGGFGVPVAMEMRYHASKPRGDRWGLGSPLRSFLLSHANHAIDFMIYQMGSIARVNAALATGGDESIALAAQFVFESGAVGTLLATSCAPHFSVAGSVMSDRGRIVRLDSLNEVVAFGLGEDAKRWGRQWVGKTLQTGFADSGYATELEQFARAAVDGAPGACHPSFADEVEVYKALDSIERLIAAKPSDTPFEARGTGRTRTRM